MIKETIQDLDNALLKAKQWCEENLTKYVYGFKGIFDYDIFHYVIDNSMIGSDMRLDFEEKGLIKVSVNKINWLQEREAFFKEQDMINAEVDLESMFVHEITESIILHIPEVSTHYILKYESPHSIASKVENVNRNERGLKSWIEY